MERRQELVVEKWRVEKYERRSGRRVAFLTLSLIFCPPFFCRQFWITQRPVRHHRQRSVRSVPIRGWNLESLSPVTAFPGPLLQRGLHLGRNEFLQLAAEYRDLPQQRAADVRE